MAQEQNGKYEKVPFEDVGSKDKKLEEPAYGYGVRHVQTFIIFLSLFIGFLSRAHLGVSIVAMTYIPSVVHENVNTIAKNVTVTYPCHNTLYDKNLDAYKENHIVIKGITVNETDDVIGENVRVENALINITYHEEDSNISWSKDGNMMNNFDNYTNENEFREMDIMTSDENGIYKKYIWSKPIQEMVLTSFFLGYCVSQYLMSMLAQRWGGKLPLQIGLFVTAIVSAATPWLAFWGGWKAVCVCRILQGVSQGGYYPAIQTLLAQWVPLNERAKLTSFVYSGSIVGTIVAFQLGGVLAVSPWGWPSIFWGTAILCFFAFIILTVFGAATPTEHKTISEDERKFITHTMSNIDKKKPRVPMKAILSSKHIWAVFSTHVGSSVVFLFIFMQVPTYIHYSLGVNVKDSGLFSSLPYVASFFSSIFYGIFSDFLTNRNILNVKNARRTFNTFAQVTVAVCLIAVTFTKSISLAITLLILAQSAHAAIHVGWMINYIDLSSNFSGAILAMGNTIMNIFTLIVPILVSNIVTDVTNQTQWQVMFFLMAGFALITNTVFVVFMSPDRQPWDDAQYEKADCDDIEMDKTKKSSE